MLKGSPINVLSCVSAGFQSSFGAFVSVKTIDVEKDSLEELVAHVRRSIVLPCILVDFQTLLFWTPNVTCGCS